MQIPLGPSEKNSLLRKSYKGAICAILREKTPFLAFPEAKKANFARLSAACTKVQNAFNPFGTIRKKFLLCKSTKKARYVRSLGKKPHFGAFPEAKKGVVNVRKAAQGSAEPNNNANPSGLSEKNVYCVESLPFCAIIWENFSFERTGVGPPGKKVVILVQRPQRPKAPQIPLGPSKKHSNLCKSYF